MNYIRLIFWYMLLSSIFGTVALGYMGCVGSTWWWLACVGEVLTVYALSEIIHTLHQKNNPPDPTSMYYKRFYQSKRYDI